MTLCMWSLGRLFEAGLCASSLGKDHVLEFQRSFRLLLSQGFWMRAEGLGC